MKIILIEDQAIFRQLLSIACRHLLPEAEVLSASNGAEGLGLCEREKPEIVLLDLVLADCDGLELAPKIRAMVPGVKILVLSAHSDEFTVHRVKRAAVDGFVDKNEQTLEVLCEALKTVLSGRAFFCSVTQLSRERMRADPMLFSKILSDREIKLVGLFGQGLSNDVIGAQLDLCSSTVRNHRQNIMTKLGLNSTPQLIHYALKKGFTRSGR